MQHVNFRLVNNSRVLQLTPVNASVYEEEVSEAYFRDELRFRAEKALNFQAEVYSSGLAHQV